jgi:DNA primase
MADFQLIKEQVTIEAVAQQLGLELRPTGAAHRGPCPACGTGGPRALVVTPSKQLFYCFSAGIGGDLISLWGHVEKCSLAEAGRHIADQFGVEELSAPVKRSAPVHSPNADSAPSPTKKASTSRETTRQEFDPQAFLQKLEYTEEVAATGLSEDDAKALGVGFYRGRLFQAARWPNGDIAGFTNPDGATLKFPKTLVRPQEAKVIRLEKQRA